MKSVCVKGLGHTGLPTALASVHAGLTVYGVETNKELAHAIANGQLPEATVELSDELFDALATPFFIITHEFQEADYYVIALDYEEKEGLTIHFLSHFTTIAHDLARVMKKGATVIVESPVPVGVTQSFAQILEKETGWKVGTDFFVAYVTHRVSTGNIMAELKVRDRVIGGITLNDGHHAAEFYKYFVSGDLYLTQAATAELVKLVESGFRDVSIALSHQIASMVAPYNINPYEVIELANKNPRLMLLQPSAGPGGYSIPRESDLLIQSCSQGTELIKKARAINKERSLKITSTIEQAIDHVTKASGKKPTVLLLGVTYKPNVKNLYCSSAYAVAELLHKSSDICDLLIADPYVSTEKLPASLESKMVHSHEGLQKADIIVALVRHTPFMELCEHLLKDRIILDFCGLFYHERKNTINQEQYFWPARPHVNESLSLKSVYLTTPAQNKEVTS